MSIENGFGKKGKNSMPAPHGNGKRQDGFYDEPEETDGFLDEDYGDEDFEDDLDLFDDVAIGGGNTQDDASIAQDDGMEDKLLGQAMGGTRAGRHTEDEEAENADRPAGRGSASRSGAPGYGGRGGAGKGSDGGRGGRGGNGGRTPRELNTPGSAVDQKKLRFEREQKKRSRIRKIVIWTVVELFTLALIFGYGFVVRTLSNMSHTTVDKAAVENENLSLEKKKEMEGYLNFYIFGMDSRDGNVARGNSDVIMIASINQDTGDIKLVSVFRDTYLNVNGKGTYAKINSAYASGGPEQAIAALNRNLDLNITNYVTVNWAAVAHGINILGGIDDVDISEAELFYINAFISSTVEYTGIGSHQLKHTGPQHLDGVQAVAYGRLRLMDTDFARTERQREVIQKCFEKAKKADFAVLNNILVDCFPMVSIDIPMNDLVRLAQGITRYNMAGTAGFPWSRGDANIPKKGAVVVPTTLESNVIKLHEFLFGDTDYKPSSVVLAYSEKIKEDSNLYKEGKPIESVGTDNGVIQKPKTTAADEEDEDETTKRKTKASDELETDENGDYIYPTDEDGNEILPTDEDGNVIEQTRPSQTRPTELEETEGDGGSEIVDDEGNVLGTSPRPSHTVNPTAAENGNRPTHVVNPTNPVNPTAPETESQTAHSVNPTAGTEVQPTAPAQTRPTELIPDEPQTVAPQPGGNNGPTETTATVISPTKPEPTADHAGPGGAVSDGHQDTVIGPDSGPAPGPGV